MRSLTFRRATFAALAVALLGSGGCFGSFQLTRKVYNWNKTVSPDKWVQELIFLATAALVPVYGLAAFIDAVVLNSMEFWTGKAPQVTAEARTETKVIEQGSTTVVQTMTEGPEGRSMVLEESVAGVFTARTTLTRAVDSDIVTVLHEKADGSREHKAMLREADGSLRIIDPSALLAR